MIVLKPDSKDFLYTQLADINFLRMRYKVFEEPYNLILLLHAQMMFLQIHFKPMTDEVQQWITGTKQLMNDVLAYSKNVEDTLPNELLARAKALYEQTTIEF